MSDSNRILLCAFGPGVVSFGLYVAGASLTAAIVAMLNGFLWLPGLIVLCGVSRRFLLAESGREHAIRAGLVVAASIGSLMLAYLGWGVSIGRILYPDTMTAGLMLVGPLQVFALALLVVALVHGVRWLRSDS